jgi:hypothetical protein
MHERRSMQFNESDGAISPMTGNGVLIFQDVGLGLKR